ncbi:MAG: hypothetical protein SPK22_05280 [Alloprevotella sp.]|nr:hypothetical protein [Bacteroidales bacterium]MDY5769609.1 hypothetical protein [Alloprevotella sp.]
MFVKDALVRKYSDSVCVRLFFLVHLVLLVFLVRFVGCLFKNLSFQTIPAAIFVGTCAILRRFAWVSFGVSNLSDAPPHKASGFFATPWRKFATPWQKIATPSRKNNHPDKLYSQPPKDKNSWETKQRQQPRPHSCSKQKTEDTTHGDNH